jgi:hypothetical protein
MYRLFWNLGASTSWHPQGLSRPEMGLLYLTLTFLSVSARTLHWSLSWVRLFQYSSCLVSVAFTFVYGRLHIHCGFFPSVFLTKFVCIFYVQYMLQPRPFSLPWSILVCGIWYPGILLYVGDIEYMISIFQLLANTEISCMVLWLKQNSPVQGSGPNCNI